MDSANISEELTKALGRLIAAYRRQQGLTRPQLSEALDLSDETIKKLEGGKAGLNISTFVKFASMQNKSLTQFMNDLATEAGLADEKNAANSIDHVIQNHVSREARDTLLKSAGKFLEKDLNELAWALEVAAELLTLREQDRDELELSIRRKSPHRAQPKSRARIRELLEKTTFSDLD